MPSPRMGRRLALGIGRGRYLVALAAGVVFALLATFLGLEDAGRLSVGVSPLYVLNRGFGMASITIKKLSRAQAILKANMTSDEEVAREYGVNVRTIEKWRAAMNEDPDFVDALREQRKLLTEMFMGKLATTLGQTVETVNRIVALVATDPQLLREYAADPNKMLTLVTATERLGTIQMAERVLDARLGQGGPQPGPPPNTPPPVTGGSEPKLVTGARLVRELGAGIVEEED